MPRIGTLFSPLLLALVASVAALASGCTGDAVECIIDSACPEGQYCVSTRCAEAVPLPDDREAYITQVAPLIETGCNCHGPGLGRPWSYEHRFDDPAAFDADLGALRQWLYDPIDPPGIGGETSRPTGWLYGLSGCGFNHPGIYEGPDQPQYAMIFAWAAQAWPDLPVIGINDVPVPPTDPPADGPLPELESAALARIRTLPYRQGMVEEILPRVVGQCGCCHAGDGNRSWKLLSRYPATNGSGEPINPRTMDVVDAAGLLDLDIQSIELMANRQLPDQASLLRYGLGANGRGEAHPRIYSSADDPRYRLLREWMAQGPPAPSN